MGIKITQHEIVLRYLNNQGSWVKSFNLRGVETDWGSIGTQGDKRARELAKDQGYNPDGSLKKYFRYEGKLLSGIEYEIEGDLQDGQRVYRARILNEAKPGAIPIPPKQDALFSYQGSHLK